MDLHLKINSEFIFINQFHFDNSYILLNSSLFIFLYVYNAYSLSFKLSAKEFALINKIITNLYNA